MANPTKTGNPKADRAAAAAKVEKAHAAALKAAAPAKAAPAAKVGPAKVAKPAAAPAPTRATWKGHGNPAQVVFYGFGEQPEAEGVRASVGTANGLIRIGEAESGPASGFGVATKFWAAPIAAEAKAEAAPAKAAKAAPKTPTAPKAPRVRTVAPVTLPKGYTEQYDNGAYRLAKRGEGAADGSAAWLVICTEHGTTTTAAKAKDGDALGRKAARAGWCGKCGAA